MLAPYSVVERDLLSWFLSLGRSMAVSSPGWNEGKWPKEGKPGKESLRPVARRELFPGGSSPRKPKWFEKEGWWKEAQPCLGGGREGGGVIRGERYLRRESPSRRSPIRAGRAGATGGEGSIMTGMILPPAVPSSGGGRGGGEVRGLAGRREIVMGMILSLIIPSLLVASHMGSLIGSLGLTSTILS